MSAGRGENASFQSSQRRAAACILKIYPKAGMPACGKRRVSCLYRELFFGCPFCPCRNFMENTPFPRGQKICPTYFELCQTYFELCQTYFKISQTYFGGLPFACPKRQTKVELPVCTIILNSFGICLAVMHSYLERLCLPL